MADIFELLRRVRCLQIFPTIRLTWFLSQSQELHLKAGEVYARQGEPADAMFVLLEGEFQWRGEICGRDRSCSDLEGRRRHRSAAVFADEDRSR